MSEAEAGIFDFSAKKKKKKTKTGFDLDAILADSDATPAAPVTTPPEAMDTSEKPKEEEVPADDTDLFPKKKKKSKAVNFDELSISETTDKGPADMDLEFDFTSTKKKKSKKKVDLEKLMATDEKENEKEETQKGDAWQDTERDYTYAELLERAFGELREKNPNMVTGEKRKFTIKPPLVQRVGSKKTAFVNFDYICKLLHRQPQHVLQFLLAELGASGSIDGSNQLIIKGRFLQKQIENVLRRYIKEYVTCHTCKSSETILQKDDRLYFLQCETCNSRCSVAPIKSGFQAVANKQQRQAMRQTN